MIVAQINPIAGDLEGNLAKMFKIADQCTTAPGETLIFPAYALTGYPLGDLACEKDFIVRVHQMVEKLFHNQHPVITAVPDGSGKATPVMVTEKGVQFGTKFTIIPGLTVAVSVGFEPVDCDGTDKLIILDAQPYRVSGALETLEYARMFASRIRLPLAYSNLVGASDGNVFAGGSFMLDCDGAFVSCLPLWQEGFADIGEINWPWTEEPENTWHALTIGVKDFVAKNGFKDVLVGLSGGFDSALCAAIAVDAVGANHVKTVMMPSPYTSEASMKDAKAVADCLGVSYDVLPINDLMNCFDKTLAPVFKGTEKDTTEENIQARIRGTLLMALSNKFKALLLSTSNKSEAAVGYSTLYGDMCGGLAPIKDLYKTRAYDLAIWRNNNHPRWIDNNIKKVMPYELITKAPSAELRPDQKDSDSLPAYDKLDKMLEMFIEQDASVEEVIAAGYDENDVKRVFDLLHKAEFKRQQSAVGIKMSKRSFDADWIYPITKKV